MERSRGRSPSRRRRGPRRRRRSGAAASSGRPHQTSAPSSAASARSRAPGQFAGEAADRLTDQVAVGVGVVGVPGARLPPRGGGGQRVGHGRPVGEVGVDEGPADGRDAGPVAERVADGGATLALGPELGPHRGQRVVEAHQTGVDQLQEEEGDEGLAHRVDVDQGVLLPGPGPGGVGPPADQVDHQLAVDEHGDAGTDLAPLGEVGGEGVADGGEPVEAATRDGHLGRRCRRPGRPRHGPGAVRNARMSGRAAGSWAKKAWPPS